MSTAPYAPGTAPIIARAEYAERRNRAASLARERGFDGLLVWGRGGVVDGFHDVHYFTNHFDPVTWVPPVSGLYAGLGHACVVITSDAHAVLVASDFVRDDIAIDEVRQGYDLGQAVADTLGSIGLGSARVGVVGTELLPFALASTLSDAYPGLRLEATDDISFELRRRLSSAEITMMEHAGRIGAQIYESARLAAQPGGTEGAAIGTGLAFAATVPGCAHWSFLAAGDDASQLYSWPLPPWKAAHRYDSGDVLHYDCYGFVNGYAYDLARTFTVGEEPTPEQARLNETAAGACSAMAARLLSRPTFRDLHATGLACLRDGGAEPVASFGSTEPDDSEQLGPGLGHCIGAGFFPPLVLPQGPHADSVIEPPCAISFEVFATDGLGRFAFHEDNYVVKPGKVQCVTQPPVPTATTSPKRRTTERSTATGAPSKDQGASAAAPG